MKTKAQTTLEACMFIIVFAAAIMAMAGYARRALQGNWKANADAFSEEQYDSDASRESVSAVTFAGPKIKASLPDGKGVVYDANQKLGMVKVEGWGNYSGESENDEEDY